MEFEGPWPSTIPVSWSPKVTPTLDCPSVTRRTTEVWWNDWITCPTSPPAPTTGKPTSTPSSRPLSSVIVAVKLDEYWSWVWAVTVGNDWRNGRFWSARSCLQLVLLEGTFGLGGPQLADRPLQLLVLPTGATRS